MIQVGIVEPYEIMRKGLASLIEQHEEMHVVAEAGNFTELLPQLELTRIDVLMCEPMGAWGVNLASIRSTKNRDSTLKILVISESTGEEHVQSALRAGAIGFVSKGAKLNELLQAIQNLSRGEPFLCSEVSAKLTRCIINTYSRQPHELLSSRELQILMLLVNGKSIAHAADELHLSVKTVSTHKMRLMQKMDVDSFSKLVQYAATHGLISEEGPAFS